MEANAMTHGGPVPVGGGHIDRAGRRGEKPPEGRRAAMTQSRPISAGEDCCHPTGLPRRPLVANGVNPAMQRKETSRLHSVSHGVFIETGASNLGDSHDTVLPGGDPGDNTVRLVELVAHRATKSTRGRNSPP